MTTWRRSDEKADRRSTGEGQAGSARCDVFALASRERRCVDVEAHSDSGLFDCDCGQRSGKLFAADGVTNRHVLDASECTDVASLHLIHIHLSHATTVRVGTQVIDTCILLMQGLGAEQGTQQT